MALVPKLEGNPVARPLPDLARGFLWFSDWQIQFQSVNTAVSAKHGARFGPYAAPVLLSRGFYLRNAHNPTVVAVWIVP